MKIPATIFCLLMTPLLPAVEWSIEQCSSLDLLAGRTGVADVRPSNDPHQNSDQMMEQNSGIYRGQWSWQSELPELLYDMMHTGDAAKTSPSGFTALQAACVYADENLFGALIEAGVPVDARPGDWQQLGYVGDTPLGLLIRFMHPRTAPARLRMARALLERGADPDAPMTTWKGNRVVTTVPFCEMGNMSCNHEMRLLLLSFGEKDLRKRMAEWPLDWDLYRPDLVEYMRQGGMMRNSGAAGPVTMQPRQTVGTVPLLDLIRKGDVAGVSHALESGASIEVSPRARRYGQEPLFNIPVRRKDSPEAAVEIARMLIDAGSDINALNRRGNSLRIHYDRYYTKASKALCAYLKERGSLIHPDSPMKKAEVEAAEQARLARVAERWQRLNGNAPAADQPASPAEPEAPAAEQPAAPVAESVPAADQPASPAEPESPAAEQPAAPVTEPAPAADQPASPAEPEAASGGDAKETAQENETHAGTVAPDSAEASKSTQGDDYRKLLVEVQNQLSELHMKFESEQQAAQQKSEESSHQEKE